MAWLGVFCKLSSLLFLRSLLFVSSPLDRRFVRSPFATQFLAVVTLNNASTDAGSWLRTSRIWRRGIRAVMMTLERPTAAMMRALEDGESWFHWNVPPSIKVSPKVVLEALAPSLVNLASKQLDFDWLLFGEKGTVFNLDVISDLVKQFDPNVPNLITDHLWFAYTGNAPHPTVRHGSPMAPRCVHCGQRDRQRIEGLNWLPTNACPACTWRLLRDWDKTRKELYDGTNSYNPMMLPEGELLVHMGAGVVLSRQLVESLQMSYMYKCIGDRFGSLAWVTPAVAFSHCVFATGVAPVDPGPMARNHTLGGSFAPLDYSTSDAVRDALNSMSGERCCDEACVHRLSSTASTFLDTSTGKSGWGLREEVRTLQRARDVYQFSKTANRTADDAQNTCQ